MVRRVSKNDRLLVVAGKEEEVGHHQHMLMTVAPTTSRMKKKITTREKRRSNFAVACEQAIYPDIILPTSPGHGFRQYSTKCV